MTEKLPEKNIRDILDSILANFKEKEARINSLNVFPVPDGDTGTNMLLTLKSIQQELQNINPYTLKNVADRVSFGALMGARGNSGVILSQILKGFFDIIIKEDSFSMGSIKSALKSSMDLAYNSVQNPVEGTMLTTIKDIYQVVEGLNGFELSYEDLLEIIINETEKSVLRTTFLLPVLKQAGVVDAGAQGLLEILIGLKNGMDNITPGGTANSGVALKNSPGEEKPMESTNLKKLDLISEIKNIYCTELMIKGENINLPRLKEDIESLGDSALVVGNDKLVKIHVHTNFPQKVLRRVMREGTIHDIQINNMVDQSKQAIVKESIEEIEFPVKEFGLVAIANGDGFEEIFKSIGVDVVLRGGQSMNPSTYEIVKAINKIESNNIIILPNNKNIILTANQAKKIVKKNVTVIPSTSMPQGISAVLGFNQDISLEENIETMAKSMQGAKVGEVTVAVRDANLYVGEIKKGAYIGLGNGKVRVISDNLIDAVTDLVRDIANGNEEVVTLYFGAGTTQEDNKLIESKIKSYYPGMEVEFHKGGQPLYPYIFAVE